MSDSSGEVLAADGAHETTPEATPSLGLLLTQAENAVRRRLTPSLAQVGLTFDHWRIMSVLLARPGSRMSTIAEEAVLPAATLTRHMDLLVEHAMVVRRIDPADKRRVVAALSPTGAALARRLREDERSIEAGIAEGLGASTFAALVRELSLLPHLFD